jgi:putative membrane-bound dehydrogenase-like protein
MMRARIALLCLLIPLAHAVPARQAAEPGGPFVVADGLEVTLWAESPMFFNPTNIDVDARGRVWVAEAVNYRSFNTAKLDPLTHPEGDRIVILEDTNRDGRADSAHVFVQDADLRAPLGLAVVGNQVIVSASPHLVVYTDQNGDDTPDRKEILLTGFGGYDHDHGLHALTAGPDGRWYFNAGNAGPHVVTDRAGWILRSGSLYTGGSPYNLDNQGGMVSDDGRIWVGGVALRVNPDGTDLTVLSHNFRNAYELAVDSFGDLWQNDNDDQVMTCRTTWLMEGSNAGYFSADGTRSWQADRRPGQDSFSAHWHQDDPGVLPAGDNTGAGAPAGIVRYESDLLGPRYRGLLLSADAGRNVIFGYLPRPEGPGSRSIGSTCSRASPRPMRTTSGTGSTRIGASGSARATWRSAPTAPSTSPTGTTPSSAGTRCTTGAGTDGSTASRRRDGRSRRRGWISTRSTGRSRRCSARPSTCGTSASSG